MDAQQQYRQQGNPEDTLPSSQLLSDEDISAKGNIVFAGIDEPVKVRDYHTSINYCVTVIN